MTVAQQKGKTEKEKLQIRFYSFNKSAKFKLGYRALGKPGKPGKPVPSPAPCQCKGAN